MTPGTFTATSPDRDPARPSALVSRTRVPEALLTDTRLFDSPGKFRLMSETVTAKTPGESTLRETVPPAKEATTSRAVVDAAPPGTLATSRDSVLPATTGF